MQYNKPRPFMGTWAHATEEQLPRWPNRTSVHQCLGVNASCPTSCERQGATAMGGQPETGRLHEAQSVGSGLRAPLQLKMGHGDRRLD